MERVCKMLKRIISKIKDKRIERVRKKIEKSRRKLKEMYRSLWGEIIIK